MPGHISLHTLPAVPHSPAHDTGHAHTHGGSCLRDSRGQARYRLGAHRRWRRQTLPRAPRRATPQTACARRPLVAGVRWGRGKDYGRARFTISGRPSSTRQQPGRPRCTIARDRLSTQAPCLTARRRRARTPRRRPSSSLAQRRASGGGGSGAYPARTLTRARSAASTRPPASARHSHTYARPASLTAATCTHARASTAPSPLRGSALTSMSAQQRVPLSLMHQSTL